MKDRHFNLLRWTPVVTAVVLMMTMAIVSAVTVSRLKNATYWREHTFQVVLDAQALEDKLIDAQESVQGYVGKGQANLLIEYKSDTNFDLQEFNQLAYLTRDTPEQKQRLQALASAVKAVFAEDNKVIGIYARQGSNAALKAEESVEDEDTTDGAIHELEQFTGEEKALLSNQDATEQKDYHRAAHLLVYVSMLVAGLLILANWVAGREMARRRRAEIDQHQLIGKLQTALADVKTLSGLIPICGWCKSVRSDTGYWQSVEQYVHAHTDATFTHGICPSCVGKFEADVASAGSKRL